MVASRELIAELAGRIRGLEQSRCRTECVDVPAAERLPVGFGAMLAQVDWPRGGLVEWLDDGHGAGAMSLALLALPPGLRSELLVMIDGRNEFYSPAAVSLGIDCASMVVVRTEQPADVLWSAEQALRTPGIGVVICRTDALTQRACRRLQLAAEKGGGLGVLLRPERVRREPSWAEYRFLVRPLATAGPPDERLPRRRLQVELLRARGGRASLSSSTLEPVIVELDDANGRVSLVAELAVATAAIRAAGVASASHRDFHAGGRSRSTGGQRLPVADGTGSETRHDARGS